MVLTSADLSVADANDVFSTCYHVEHNSIQSDEHQNSLTGATLSDARNVPILPSVPFTQFLAARDTLSVRVSDLPGVPSQPIRPFSLQHTLFRLETKSSSSGSCSMFPSHCIVTRSLGDFTSLHSSLQGRYKGYYIPSLIDADKLQKHFTSRETNFLKRSKALQLFLSLCCRHAVIRSSKVRSFRSVEA
jgi:hypothetical protein